MHHNRYENTAAVLPADPVPDGSSLVELSEDVYLEEVPLFNRQLEFFQVRQRTSEGKTVEQFVELLEARAREAEVHLMTREDLIIFRCHTGVVEEGMLVEWRRLETLSLPEMKRAMMRYKAGKAQKKALKKERERGARAAWTQDKDSGGGGGGGKKNGTLPYAARSLPSGNSRVFAVTTRDTWPRTAASAGRTSPATPADGRGTPPRCACPATRRRTRLRPTRGKRHPSRP